MKPKLETKAVKELRRKLTARLSSHCLLEKVPFFSTIVDAILEVLDETGLLSNIEDTKYPVLTAIEELIRAYENQPDPVCGQPKWAAWYKRVGLAKSTLLSLVQSKTEALTQSPPQEKV